VHSVEHYALDTTHDTSEPIVQPTEGGSNTDSGDIAAVRVNAISGYAYDANQNPLEGVAIYIRVVPESSGEPYQTTTGADGAYSYSVPGGVYLVLAEYNGAYLQPTNGDGSVTVPPSGEVDFQMSS
jgi:hypothetical protein